MRNGLGTAALVLGIIGVLCGLVPLLFWAAGVLAVLALVFGFVGIGRARRGQATNRGAAPGKQSVATYAVSLPADAARTLEVQVEPGFLRYDSATWSGSAG